MIKHLYISGVGNGDDLTHQQRFNRLVNVLEQAKVKVQAVDDLLAARWSKLVWNVPFNGLCTLLNCSTQDLVTNASGRAMVQQLMREVQQGASADGRQISDQFIEKMMIDTENAALCPQYATRFSSSAAFRTRGYLSTANSACSMRWS